VEREKPALERNDVRINEEFGYTVIIVSCPITNQSFSGIEEKWIGWEQLHGICIETSEMACGYVSC